jgi:hypothetical protein
MDEHAFCMVECDIPEGMTLQDWRRRNCTANPPRRSLAARLLRLR